jgi:TPR repeat protein
MPKLRFENWKLADIRAAAENDDVDAQIYLGWYYSSGKDVTQDKSEAVRWYLKAAQSGRLDAQTALGWLYFSDAPEKRDLNESAKWYIRASAQGDVTARIMLQRISQQ